MITKRDVTVALYVVLAFVIGICLMEPRGTEADQLGQIERLKRLEIMENNALAASYGRKLTFHLI